MFRLAVSILSLLVDWSESPAAHKDVSKACLRPCGICTVGARNVICTNGVWRDFKRCCFENSCRERSLLAAPTKRVMIRWERWTSGAHCLQPLQWLGSHRDGPYGREWGEEKKYKSETKCILDAWFRLCCVGLSSLFVIYFFFFVLDLYFYVRMGKWEFSLYGTFLSRVSIWCCQQRAGRWCLGFLSGGEGPLKVFVLLYLILLCVVLNFFFRNVGVVSKTT